MVELGRAEEALKEFTQAIKLNSGQPDYWSRRGEVQNKLKMFKEALADFEKATTINDSVAVYFLNIGLSKLGLERVEDALKDFERATCLDRNLEEAWFRKGEAMHSLG